MKLDGVLTGLIDSSGDPGAFLKQELEKAISPVSDRVDSLEKKLDQLISLCTRIENLLKKMQPVVDLLRKVPFLK